MRHKGAGRLEHCVFWANAAQFEGVTLGELRGCPAQDVLDRYDGRVGFVVFIERVTAEAVAGLVVTHAHAADAGGCAEDAFADPARH